MSENLTNNDQLDEQLTAYLDGELPPGEARRVEDLLAGDDRARKRLNQLASSWDLLDQLPRVAVDEKFARTTVEMVAVSVEKDLAEAKAAEPSRRTSRWLAAAVIALLAAGVGFTAVSVATPNNNDALLIDLPVIVNLEQYRPVGSIDLLRELMKSKSFPGDFRPRAGQFTDRPDGKKDSRNEPRVEPEKAIVVVPAELEERREWVAKQPAEEKLELRRNFERFAALAPAEQASLRTLDGKLNAATDREELVKMMRRYNDELRRLSPVDRGAFEDLSVEQKIARIEQRRHERESRVFFQFRGVQDYAMRNEQKLLSQLPSETKAVLQKVKDENQQIRGPWNPYYSRLLLEAWRNPKVELPLPSDSDLQPIVRHIQQLPEGSTLKKQIEGKSDPKQIVAVLREAVQTGSFAREMGPRGWGGGWGGNRWRFDREQFIQNLPPEQKKKLEGLKGQEYEDMLNEILRDLRGGDRNRFPEFQRFGPGEGPPGGFGSEGPRPDGARGEGPRGEGPRGEGRRRGGPGREGDRGPDGGPRGERKGPDGPPPDFGPGEGFPPPPDDGPRPEREPMKD